MRRIYSREEFGRIPNLSPILLIRLPSPVLTPKSRVGRQSLLLEKPKPDMSTPARPMLITSEQ